MNDGKLQKPQKTEIYFKCEGCGTHLCAEASGGGATGSCPGCNTPVVVPKISISHNCPHCTQQLAYVSSVKGETILCPACKKEIVLSAGSGTPEQKSPSPSASGSDVSSDSCPACGTKLPVKSVICVNCGLNIKTGKRLTTNISVTDSSTSPSQSHEEDSPRPRIPFKPKT